MSCPVLSASSLVSEALGQQADPAVVAAAPKQVPAEEWWASVRAFFEETEGYSLVETPDGDMRMIEDLLGVDRGFFPVPYAVKTRTGFECCKTCNRTNNFLDVVNTGLKVHTAAFLRKVFDGEYGHILNAAQSQPCDCFGCGSALPAEATKFSAPSVPRSLLQETGPETRFPPYHFQVPVYTYRF